MKHQRRRPRNRLFGMFVVAMASLYVAVPSPSSVGAVTPSATAAHLLSIPASFPGPTIALSSPTVATIDGVTAIVLRFGER